MKPTDAELRQLARDACLNKGWDHLPALAKAAVKDLKSYLVSSTSKTGKCITVRYPRIDVSLKSKMGRLDTTLTPHQQDMERLQKRLDPAAFETFKAKLREMLNGIEHTIEAISMATCQATGRPGAKRIRECGVGWVRTLHPSVARKLQVKQKRISSWVLV